MQCVNKFYKILSFVVIFVSLSTAQNNWPTVAKITWIPATVQITSFPGSQVSQPVTFVSNRNVQSMTLQVTGDAAQFITLDPSTFSNISANNPGTLNIRLNIPNNAAIGIYQGTITAIAGSRILSDVLPFRLQVDPAPINEENSSCNALFLKTTEDITAAELGSGLEAQILNIVGLVAERYYQARLNQKQYMRQLLINAISLVSVELAPNLPADSRNTAQQSLLDLRQCVTSDNRPFATITAKVFASDGSTTVSGAEISINGFRVGTTSTDGTLTFPARGGGIDLGAESSETTSITIDPGESQNVTFTQKEEPGESYADSPLILAESSNGVLDGNFPTFSLKFLKGNNTAPIVKLFEVTLFDSPNTPDSSEEVVYLTDQFTVSPSGIITPINLNSFRSMLAAREGVLRLEVGAVDNDETEYKSEIEFQIGKYQVNARFQAPPSSPSLSLAGLPVKVKLTPGKVIYHLATNSNGGISLPKIPAGVFEVTSETLQGGKYYYGQGISRVSNNFMIDVNFLNTTDRLNGVAPFTVTPQFNDIKEGASIGQNDPRRLEEGWKHAFGFSERNVFDNMKLSSPNEVNISTTAGAQGVPATRSGTITVPKGTETVVLKYSVQTDEYPTYVLSQSIYDDLWSISVETGTGQRIFSNSKRVNEQVRVQPTWQSDGTTGELQETPPTGQVMALGKLTAEADLVLTVFIAATNVGDSILPTSVHACLGCTPLSVTIEEITSSDSLKRKDSGKLVESEYYSIPRQSEKNFYQRTFRVKAPKSEGSTYKSVKVELKPSDGGAPFGTIFEADIPNDRIKVIEDQEALDVTVTFPPDGNSSPFDTDPPPTDGISYYFKVTVTDGTEDKSAEKGAGAVKPLWRMPENIPRFPKDRRDEGLDDWSSKKTYLWLTENSDQLVSINDISGEHAKDLTHSDHGTGDDIDAFHPYSVVGSTLSGCETHLALRERVIHAPTNPVFRESVKNWVLMTRSKLDELAGLSDVTRLYYSSGQHWIKRKCDWGKNEEKGPVIPELSKEWTIDLLLRGKVLVNSQLLDLGIPVWQPSVKVRFNNGHDSHLHVSLSRSPQ